MPEGPKKNFFEAAPSPYIRVWMTVPTPPPPTLSDNSVNMSARVFEVKNTISIFNTKILLDDVLNLKYKFIFIFLAHWFCKNLKTRVAIICIWELPSGCRSLCVTSGFSHLQHASEVTLLSAATQTTTINSGAIQHVEVHKRKSLLVYLKK